MATVNMVYYDLLSCRYTFHQPDRNGRVALVEGMRVSTDPSNTSMQPALPKLLAITLNELCAHNAWGEFRWYSNTDAVLRETTNSSTPNLEPNSSLPINQRCAPSLLYAPKFWSCEEQREYLSLRPINKEAWSAVDRGDIGYYTPVMTIATHILPPSNSASAVNIARTPSTLHRNDAKWVLDFSSPDAAGTRAVFFAKRDAFIANAELVTPTTTSTSTNDINNNAGNGGGKAGRIPLHDNDGWLDHTKIRDFTPTKTWLKSVQQHGFDDFLDTIDQSFEKRSHDGSLWEFFGESVEFYS